MVALSDPSFQAEEGELPTTEPAAVAADLPEAGLSLVVVLLAGGFSPPPIAEATGCSPLDLFLSEDQTVWGRWQEAIGRLGDSITIDEVLCVCGGSVSPPGFAPGAARVIDDESDYRGPAGALLDAVGSTRDTGPILVAEAARICNVDLGEFLRATCRGMPR